MTQQAPPIIQQYARLLDQRDAALAMGKKPHPEVLTKIQHIETQAQATLTPAQQAHAMSHVNMLRLHSAEKRAQAITETREQLHARALREQTQRATQGMMGLREGLDDPKQVLDVAQGKPVKIRNRVPRLDRKQMDKQFMDKYGKNTDARLDDLHQAMEARRVDPRRAEKLMEQNNITPQQVDDYERHGLKFAWLMREAEQRKDEPDYHEHTPSNHDEIRAALNIAAAQHDPQGAVDTTPNRYLSEPAGSMHGDLARAWDAHENLEREVIVQQGIDEVLTDENV